MCAAYIPIPGDRFFERYIVTMQSAKFEIDIDAIKSIFTKTKLSITELELLRKYIEVEPKNRITILTDNQAEILEIHEKLEKLNHIEREQIGICGPKYSLIQEIWRLDTESKEELAQNPVYPEKRIPLGFN